MQLTDVGLVLHKALLSLGCTLLISTIWLLQKLYDQTCCKAECQPCLQKEHTCEMHSLQTLGFTVQASSNLSQTNPRELKRVSDAVTSKQTSSLSRLATVASEAFFRLLYGCSTRRQDSFTNTDWWWRNMMHLNYLSIAHPSIK